MAKRQVRRDPPCWAGVDVGGSRKGFDAAVVDARGLIGGPEPRLMSPEAVVEWLVPFRAAIVAIDSPRHSYYEWIARGFDLYAALARAETDWDVIEVFPTASLTRWASGRGAMSRAAWSAAALDSIGLEHLPRRQLSQDARDAIAAAVTARALARGQVERFGDIVVPLAADSSA